VSRRLRTGQCEEDRGDEPGAQRKRRPSNSMAGISRQKSEKNGSGSRTAEGVEGRGEGGQGHVDQPVRAVGGGEKGGEGRFLSHPWGSAS